MEQTHPFEVFGKLRWIDGRPLMPLIEPYRKAIFEKAYKHDEGLDKSEPGTSSRVSYNLILCGRAKKNWKSADLALWCLYKLCFWLSWAGNQVYALCNDEDQARDNLELGKKIITVNNLEERLVVKQNVVERRDGRGFWEILPAGDIVGTHGKTYLLAAFDEIHGYKNWDILEAMQLDPSRPDAQMWLTSYASIYHKPGVPLFDLSKLGREGKRPRMLFSWYSSMYSTDPDFENATPERRANPSSIAADDEYLEQQRLTLPAHKFRRLHLNEPGLPEGSAFTFEAVDAAIERGVKARLPQAGCDYFAFVDMSGGSNDDAVLCIAHREGEPGSTEGRAVVDRVVNQGQRPPFDPRKAVARFAAVVKEYRVFSVTGDKYAGETFIQDFAEHGVSYRVSELTKSELYEAMEPRLNAGQVALLDEPKLESQFLSLIWKGGKIDHPSGEHDDYSNACAGAVHIALQGGVSGEIASWGERTFKPEGSGFFTSRERGSWLDEF